MATYWTLVVKATALLCFCTIQVCAEDEAGKQVTQEIATVGREMRRFGGMLLPLLIGISTRLAAIIPTAFLGVIGVFIFVALAKKAFVISVLSFLMAYRHKHSKPKIMHIHHHSPHHSHGEFEHFDSPPPSPVYYSYDSNGPYSHKKRKKWPKIDEGQSWGVTGPQGNINMESYIGQPILHPSSYMQQTTRHPNTFMPRLTTMDSFLPQTTRDSYLPQRRRDDILPPFLYSPQHVYYPRFLWDNATETPLQSNGSVGVTPQLEAFVDKALQEEEEEDPR